jgi:thiol-disulfide isomerase/thioredoxin
MPQRLILTTAILFSLILHGCAKKESGDSSATKGTASIAENVAEVITVESRADMAPNFTWKDASGKSISFDSFRGTVTVVNFWATWCVPCKKEIPDLIELSKELADKNVKVIGIATDRGLNVTAEISAFVKEHNMPYQIVVSTEDLETAFNNVRMMPTTFLVDDNGTIAQTLVGIRTKQALLEAINSVLPQ